jgi:hypothetical protein
LEEFQPRRAQRHQNKGHQDEAASDDAHQRFLPGDHVAQDVLIHLGESLVQFRTAPDPRDYVTPSTPSFLNLVRHTHGLEEVVLPLVTWSSNMHLSEAEELKSAPLGPATRLRKQSLEVQIPEVFLESEALPLAPKDRVVKPIPEFEILEVVLDPPKVQVPEARRRR